MPRSWKRTGVAPEGFAIVPPDGGWAWMVLIGCSIMAACYMTTLLVFYMIINDLKDEFQVDTFTVTLPMTLFNSVAGIFAPVASVITGLSSARKCVMFGGILLSLTLLLSSFVGSIWQMAAVCAIFGGLGTSCVNIPIQGILAQYFKNHFQLAIGIYYTSYSIAKMSIPLLLEYLLREYSWRECMLILSALTLNCCVGAATVQPSRWHLKLKPLPAHQTYIELNTTDHPDSPNENKDNLSDKEEAHGFLIKLRKSLDLDLLKNPMFYLTSITYSLLMAEVVLSGRFLNVFGVEVGLTSVEAAWLMSTNAIGEIFGRISGPVILKLLHWPDQASLIVFSAIASVLYVAFALMTSPWSLYLLAASSDFFFSWALVITPSLMLQSLGATKLVAVIGYSEFMLGFMMLALGAFSGWLHDVTGTYASCYFLFAFMIASITFMWSLRSALYKLKWFISN